MTPEELAKVIREKIKKLENDIAGEYDYSYFTAQREQAVKRLEQFARDLEID